MTTNTYTERSQGAHRAKAGIVSGAGRLEVLVLLATIAIGIALGVVFGSFSSALAQSRFSRSA